MLVADRVDLRDGRHDGRAAGKGVSTRRSGKSGEIGSVEPFKAAARRSAGGCTNATWALPERDSTRGVAVDSSDTARQTLDQQFAGILAVENVANSAAWTGTSADDASGAVGRESPASSRPRSSRRGPSPAIEPLRSSRCLPRLTWAYTWPWHATRPILSDLQSLQLIEHLVITG